MIKFEKVSKEEFVNDSKKFFPQLSESDIETAYENITLPRRSSKGSAGYDIYTPFGFLLDTHDQTITIPTGIRAVMPSNMFLAVVPRSGMGFKTGSSLANTIGIIDSDYIVSPNEGHIMLKIVYGFNSVTAEPGDRVAQGIFLKYYITDDDKVAGVRKGGLGSSGK